MSERDRILQVMQSSGMNAKQFCQEVRISQGTLSNIIGGRNKPSLDVMQAVLRRFRGVSCDWLIMGVGTMYVNGVHEEGILNLFDGKNEEKKTTDTIESSHAVVKDIQQGEGAAVAVNPIVVPAQRTVSKILVFYSDGTFEER